MVVCLDGETIFLSCVWIFFLIPGTAVLIYAKFFLKKAQRRIAIEGNIGAGKTTFVTQTHQENYKLIPEEVESILLAEFYKDPQLYGFQYQLHCFAQRINARATAPTDVDLIFDRSLLGDKVFAKANLSKADYLTYKCFFDAVYPNIRKEDLIIYLKLPVSILDSRIKKRGRESESTITREYLQKLEKLYEEELTEISKTKPVYEVIMKDLKREDYSTMFSEIMWDYTTYRRRNGIFLMDPKAQLKTPVKKSWTKRAISYISECLLVRHIKLD